MRNLSSRRGFLAATAAGGAASIAAEPAIPGNFPSHPPALAKEMVTVAHGNAARVRDLLSVRPILANAAWEWGFGDWETPLGAASHMGRRDIAEILLAHGAHPTIFSAAMLGQLEVVKAIIAARPEARSMLGPHSIPLLAHARVGGEKSAEVVRYLQSLSEANGPATQDISEEELAEFAGEYVFGRGPDDRIDISPKGKQLTFTRKGGDVRPLHYVGDRAFRPAGATAVRIRFGDASEMTVHDGDLLIRATRR